MKTNKTNNAEAKPEASTTDTCQAGRLTASGRKIVEFPVKGEWNTPCPVPGTGADNGQQANSGPWGCDECSLPDLPSRIIADFPVAVKLDGYEMHITVLRPAGDFCSAEVTVKCPGVGSVRYFPDLQVLIPLPPTGWKWNASREEKDLVRYTCSSIPCSTRHYTLPDMACFRGCITNKQVLQVPLPLWVAANGGKSAEEVHRTLVQNKRRQFARYEELQEIAMRAALQSATARRENSK